MNPDLFLCCSSSVPRPHASAVPSPQRHPAPPPTAPSAFCYTHGTSPTRGASSARRASEPPSCQPSAAPAAPTGSSRSDTFRPVRTKNDSAACFNSVSHLHPTAAAAAQALHLANQPPQQQMYSALAHTPPSMTPGPNPQSPQASFPSAQQTVYIHPQQVQHGYNPSHMAHVQQVSVTSGYFTGFSAMSTLRPLVQLYKTVHATNLALFVI